MYQIASRVSPLASTHSQSGRVSVSKVESQSPSFENSALVGLLSRTSRTLSGLTVGPVLELAVGYTHIPLPWPVCVVFVSAIESIVYCTVRTLELVGRTRTHVRVNGLDLRGYYVSQVMASYR